MSLINMLATTEHRMDNLLDALADGLLPAEHIQNKYGAEKNKKRQLSYRLHQLKDSLESGPVELPTFRELLRRELQQDEKARKEALHALIERIKAYPDRKMEVKFRIGEKVKGTHGGQHSDPHESKYPAPGFTTVLRFDYLRPYLVLSADNIFRDLAETLIDISSLRQSKLQLD